MENLLIDKVIDRAAKIIAIKKDEFPPDIRERINKGALKLEQGILYHTANFSTLAESVELFIPNHKSGPGYSSFIDGKITDKIFVVQFISLLYKKDNDFNYKYSHIDQAVEGILSLANVELYKNEKQILSRQAYSFLETKQGLSRLDTASSYKDVLGLNLRHQIVILPEDRLQLSMKFIHGQTATYANGITFRVEFHGVYAKIR